MLEISFSDFEKRDYNTSGISNVKLVGGKCLKCGCNYNYSNIKKFMGSRKFNEGKKHLWNTCSKCWLRIQTGENPEWILKNSESQKISQNKPEQKIKNAEGVSRSWTSDRKKEASLLLKSRWDNDPDFCDKALKNLAWTQTNNELREKIIKKSFGIGGLKGMYNNIFYDSALELSYILWCEEYQIKIVRYDLDPIDYIDENGKIRKYFPDFIINNDTVVEIKGKGLYYKRNYERNIQKFESAKKFFNKYLMILGDDKILRRHYRKARTIHHASKNKKTN